jgi:aldehyde dehydrogenase (NAD+)
VGDPFDPKTEQGPQVDDVQFDKVMSYIDPARRTARDWCAAAIASGDRGYFVQPTVFADVTDNMKIAEEEIFGPVMSIIKFKDIDEVVERANQDDVRPGRGRLDARYRQSSRHRQQRPRGHGVGQLL